MAWTSLTYAFGSVLTSSKMTQNQDNFTALAQGLSGAPKIQTAALEQTGGSQAVTTATVRPSSAYTVLTTNGASAVAWSSAGAVNRVFGVNGSGTMEFFSGSANQLLAINAFSQIGFLSLTEAIARPGASTNFAQGGSATVTNTTTETTVFSTTVTGGVLGSTRSVRLNYACRVFFNDGTTDNTLTIRVKYGATTIGTFTITFTGGVHNSGNTRPSKIDSHIFAQGATNSQACTTLFYIGEAVGSTGASGGIFGYGISNHTACAEDSTADKTFAVTVQWSNATVNAAFYGHAAILEVV